MNANRSGRRLVVILGGVLAAAIVLAYADSFKGEFVYDDGPSILHNPTVQRLWPPFMALSPPAGSGLPVAGRPLVNASFAVNFALGKADTFGYHLFNVALHVAAALALFGLVRRTLVRLERGNAEWIGASVGLVWGLHPLTTEAVAYISQRAESMAALFLLLTLYSFARSAESRNALRAWVALSVFSCFMGMAAKETMAAAPLIVLLYDRTFVSGSFAAAWRSNRRMYIALATSWALIAYLAIRAGTRGGTAGAAAPLGIWWSYTRAQALAIVHYVRLAIWPSPLVFDYGVDISASRWSLWTATAVLAAGLAGTFWALWRRPIAGFLGAAFFLILAPSSSFVPVLSEPWAEHRMYLPLAALVVPAVAILWSKLGRVAALAVVILSLVLGAATWERNLDYRSEYVLWKDTAAKAPGNVRALFNLGIQEGLLGHWSKAAQNYRRAIEIRPSFGSARTNLSGALLELGKPAEAALEAEQAVGLNPRSAQAHSNFGRSLAGLGRWPQALNELEAAEMLDPTNPVVERNLASGLAAVGRFEEALEKYRMTLQLSPSDKVSSQAIVRIQQLLTHRNP